MVMRELAKIGLVGGAVGLAAALLLGRAAASLLFGVEFKDPLVIAGAGAALIAVTLAAGFLPARRASRVDPMVALRSD
ncbi:FtsX-like permease family protein [compost metagenome]